MQHAYLSVRRIKNLYIRYRHQNATTVFILIITTSWHIPSLLYIGAQLVPNSTVAYFIVYLLLCSSEEHSLSLIASSVFTHLPDPSCIKQINKQILYKIPNVFVIFPSLNCCISKYISR